MNNYHKKNHAIIFFIITSFIIIFFSSPVKAEDPGCCKVTNPAGTFYYEKTYTECTKLNNSSIGIGTGSVTVATFEADKVVSENKDSCVSQKKPLEGPSKVIPPVLSVSIPGFGKFSDVECSDPNTPCKIPWIGEYLSSIYKYSVSAIGILAVIMTMIGGVIWLTAGGSKEKAGTALGFIKSGILGIILITATYVILFVVNPNLTILSPVNIQYIKFNESLSDADYQAATKTKHSMNKGETSTQATQSYILEKYAKNIYQELTTQNALASDTFDPPANVPWLDQCGEEIANKDYSKECNTSCNEPKPRHNELCKDQEPISGDKYFSTVCSSGCGVMSEQMVLGAWGKIGQTANDTIKIVKFMERNDNWRVCPGGGTSQEGIKTFAESMGMQAEVLGKEKKAYVDKLLEAGYPIMVSLNSASGCTKAGHWIVLVRKDGNRYKVNNPIDNGKCQGSVSANISGINRYVFIHPAGTPDIDMSSSCVNKWDWGCSYNSQDCCDGKCIFGDDACSINSKNLAKTSCYKCGTCIDTWHWGCKKSSDCCSGKCHTSGDNKYQCYE